MERNSIILNSDFREAFLKHARKLHPKFSMSDSNWERLDRIVMNEIQRVHAENFVSEQDEAELKYMGRLGTELWWGKLALFGISIWILTLTVYVIVSV